MNYVLMDQPAGCHSPLVLVFEYGVTTADVADFLEKSLMTVDKEESERLYQPRQDSHRQCWMSNRRVHSYVLDYHFEFDYSSIDSN